MKKTNEFIQEDLSENTAVSYLKMACERKDEKVEQSARNLIIENFGDIDQGQLVVLPTELFHSIVCFRTLGAKLSSEPHGALVL